MSFNPKYSVGDIVVIEEGLIYQKYDPEVDPRAEIISIGFDEHDQEGDPIYYEGRWLGAEDDWPEYDTRTVFTEREVVSVEKG